MRQKHNIFELYADNLEMLAEKLSDVLGRPVTVEDANHRLVAYSSHEPETDPARLATIVGRRVPDTVISSLWHSGVIARLLESEDPIRVPAMKEIGLSERVAIAIRSNTGVLGYIWVVEAEGPFTEEEMGVLKQAAAAARVRMAQWQMQRHKDEGAQADLFWQLLTGHLQTESLVREKAAKIGITLPSLFHVVVLQFASDVKERRQQQVLERFSAEAHFRIVFRAVDKSELVLLCTPLVYKTRTDVVLRLEAMNRNLQAFFKEEYRGLASGGLYNDYSKLEASYQEALLLLQIKQRFQEETAGVVYYADLGFYRYLPLLWQESRKHGSNNECVARLRAYDLEHHSELLHTLTVFLAHDSNVKTAADALHIHMNTLNYRLKRISEVGGIDLTDMDQKVTLYLDLKAEKFGDG
ncbi:PucR family transcriptional regulator [Paenibacillus puldeungensis]|uniref:PucR family transcriptional regulator n=1 Tax=Paenibacillus puldeungensis TaxID=696536 RepID=A0ABW3RR89_9BACL